ncbi:phospholipase D family protein [Duganella aceris]|uniref:Phospholipase D-like domain-containing protein n=1 Tax=Duganella aceris TaxID=2703883 RepID=A0ABX0FQH7_9BURK|nr:phospholipase D family protein [Duganella aceris]NGZ86614.1 hypothetical protein [Duganella aceris]
MNLINDTQIKKALHAVRSKHIAVAYVGADWKSFVDENTLDEIIVSPTAGSSADAIKELVQCLGWKNVHFLDELHAKIYLGETSAAMGSFNLTANGLSGHALIEAGYLIQDPAQLKFLRKFYADLKGRAVQQYDSQIKKEQQLSRLIEINAKAREVGFGAPASSRTRTLEEYNPVTDTDFYCAFYTNEKLKYNEQALRKQHPAKFNSEVFNPDELIKANLPFLSKDKILSGHWVLMWKAWIDEPAPLKMEAQWMYIQAIVPNGAEDREYGYTKLAIQWEGARGIGSPPFTLKQKQKAALKELLVSGKFPEFFPDSSGKAWSLNRTFPNFKAFVAEWKRLATA